MTKMTQDVTADRLGKIGGSDLPAVLGFDPYTTPYQAWRRITGKEPAKPMNHHMRRGKALEQGVAEYVLGEMNDGSPDYDEPIWMKRGARIEHPRHAFLIGHPDFYLVDDNQKQLYLLEVKCPERFEAETPPSTYMIQVNYYLGLLKERDKTHHLPPAYGCDINNTAYLAVSHGPIDRFILTFDSDKFDAHVQQAVEWHERYVVADVPPPFITEGDVLIAHPVSKPGSRVELNPEDANWIATLAEIGEDIGKLEQQKKELNERLKIMLGDAEELVAPDGTVLATWKTHEKDSVDFVGLREAHPAILASFSLKKPVRTLLLKREQIRKVVT